MSDLRDDIRKYRGLPPYNTRSNTAEGCGYFLRSMYRKHGEDKVREALKTDCKISPTQSK